MRSSLLLTASAALAAATTAYAQTAPDETTPAAHDGPYITNPPPGPGNNAVEWWWYQVVGPENSDGFVPSLEVIFYQGFAFTLAAGQPRWQFDVSGVWPNGTAFFITVPVSDAPAISMPGGSAVVGDWGGLGCLSLSADGQTAELSFTADAFGLTGSVTLQRDGTPAHVACATDDTAAPYFSQLAAGKTLTDNETLLLEQTGWFIEMPRAVASASLQINGTAFSLDGVSGYHDHNWAPQTLDKFAFTWLTGQGSCGPFDLAYLETQTVGSGRADDLMVAILAENGEFITSQCYLYGNPAANTVNITLTGQTTDPVTTQQVPTGIELEYTVASGDRYAFSLTNNVDNPSQLPYHRWRLVGKGGKVGDTQYDCNMIGDWLNPGLATYTEGQSIFEEQ